jgi:plastocyanin
MKTIISIIVVLLLAGGVAGFVIANNKDAKPSGNNTSQTDTSNDTETTGSDTTQPTEQAVRANSVEISGSAYSPAKITVKKGTTVTWTNRDSLQHDISPDNPSDEFKQSELLNRGETYSVTFNTVGTFTYHCTPHPFMMGSVEVVE